MDDQNKIVTVSITLAEVNGILVALDQLPHGQVRALIDKIRGQVGPQLIAPATTEEVK